VAQVGNWSADKGNYYTRAQVDTNISTANTSMQNYVNLQNSSVANYVTTVNTSMKNYVDFQDTAYNTSNNNYIASNNNSNNAYITSNNQSVNNYILYVNSTNGAGIGSESLWNANYSTFLTHITFGQVSNGTIWSWIMNGTVATAAYVGIQNTSMQNYIDNTFNTTRNNYLAFVNTSMKNYVDFQNTSQTNNINTKLNLSGGTMTGNLNLSANVNLTMNGGNQIGSNVTCVTIKGSTSILEVC